MTTQSNFQNTCKVNKIQKVFILLRTVGAYISHPCKREKIE